MHVLLTLLVLLFVGLLSFQSIRAYAGNKTEQQPYQLIKKCNGFEIRWYPSAMMATMQSKATTFRTMGYTGFRKLAGYIFGNNAAGTKIAMTAPVHMDMNDTKPSMSFVMPSAYAERTLPAPNDPEVRIVKSKEEFVASIRFGGFVSDKKIAYYTKKLDTLLRNEGIRHSGNFRYLGYNPPFQLINRRNEVIVTIDWSPA